MQQSLYSGGLNSIACPSISTCFTVGSIDGSPFNYPFAGRNIIKSTTDGGNIWQTLYSSTTDEFQNIACPSTCVCFLTASILAEATRIILASFILFVSMGEILMTDDGGSTWKSQKYSTTSGLSSIACPGVNLCIAVSPEQVVNVNGRSGTLVAKDEPSPSTKP